MSLADQMMNGWIGDMRAEGHRRAAEAAQLHGMRVHTDDLLRKNAEIQELDKLIARFHAYRHTLERALAQFCPEHPLLTSVALRERVGDAGQKALMSTSDWDATKQAGRNFDVFGDGPVKLSPATVARLKRIAFAGQLDKDFVRKLESNEFESGGREMLPDVNSDGRSGRMVE